MKYLVINSVVISVDPVVDVVGGGVFVVVFVVICVSVRTVSVSFHSVVVFAIYVRLGIVDGG